jgi:DNA-binding response OmpR family regulator
MRLLLVEDEPKMCELLSEGLIGQGHDVTSALNGREGLSLATEFHFDAMILDRMLPLLDGTEVARRMRHAGRGIPILMLTARDSVSDVVEGLDAGVDDYLAKPFSLVELYARVRALGRRAPAISTKVLRCADLELDIDAFRLQRGDDLVNLTRTEFRIVEYMMKRPERVHRREAIIEAVWGCDCEVSSNTLDVFIRQIRSKVDDRYTIKRIETVRGTGYRLNGERES